MCHGCRPVTDVSPCVSVDFHPTQPLVGAACAGGEVAVWHVGDSAESCWLIGKCVAVWFQLLSPSSLPFFLFFPCVRCVVSSGAYVRACLCFLSACLLAGRGERSRKFPSAVVDLSFDPLLPCLVCAVDGSPFLVATTLDRYVVLWHGGGTTSPMYARACIAE